MLLVVALILDFESHGGEIVIFFFFKRAKWNKLLREPSVGRRNATRVGEGRKDRRTFAIQLQGPYRSWGRQRLLCGSGSELRLEEEKEGRR